MRYAYLCCLVTLLYISQKYKIFRRTQNRKSDRSMKFVVLKQKQFREVYAFLK